MAPFDGRVALVTGAGRGLGRAYALLLGRLGAKVVVNNRTAEKAREVVSELQEMGATAVADAHNVVTEGEKAVETAMKHFGRLDIVINNAGQLRDRTFKKMTWEEWEDVINTHLHGTFHVTSAAWKVMREQKYGRIVMVSSGSAITGNVGQANYSAAKGAVTTLAQTLAMEGAKDGIVVNAVATAGLTRMTERFGTHTDFTPERTAFGVAYFCHEDCADSGGFYRVQGSTVFKIRYMTAPHKTFDTGTPNTSDKELVQLFGRMVDEFGETADFTDSANIRFPMELKHGTVKEMRQLSGRL